jgi:hypothetical protein
MSLLSFDPSRRREAYIRGAEQVLLKKLEAELQENNNLLMRVMAEVELLKGKLREKDRVINSHGIFDGNFLLFITSFFASLLTLLELVRFFTN